MEYLSNPRPTGVRCTHIRADYDGLVPTPGPVTGVGGFPRHIAGGGPEPHHQGEDREGGAAKEGGWCVVRTLLGHGSPRLEL